MTLLKTLTLALSLSSVFTVLTKAQNEEAFINRKFQKPLVRTSTLPIQHNIGYNSFAFETSTNTMPYQPIIGSEIEYYIHMAGFSASNTPTSAGEINYNLGNKGLNYSSYNTSKTIDNVTWCIGPSVDIPTTSHTLLGSNKWNTVASKKSIDLVLPQTASFAVNNNKMTENQFLAQTQLVYNLGKDGVPNTFNALLEVEAEQALEIENWMVEENNFVKSINLETKVEEEMSFENQLTNEFLLNLNLESVMETMMELEDWMTDEKIFTIDKAIETSKDIYQLARDEN